MLALALAIQFLLRVLPCAAGSLAATPFYTFNQSPLVQIYGLPAAESSRIERPGHLRVLGALDIANSFATDSSGTQFILIDAESYRTTLAFRYGLTEKLELGADLPLVSHNGGIFDTVIEDWHGFFGLAQGGRLDASRDRLLVTYWRDGREQLHLGQPNVGLGDLRLTGGWQLYDGGTATKRSVALRASLKLPTGSSSQLHGSGSTDFSLWLSGSDDYSLPGSWGDLALFGAGGALFLSDGRVLTHQQNNLVGFGSLGLGWAPLDWLAIKTQFSTHSPFYSGSNLPELGQPTVQMIFGASFAFSPKTVLDIAFSEDLVVSASPDFAMHLGLNRYF